MRTSPEPHYPETVYEIVGVVPDTKYANLREEIPPASFAPTSQHPNPGPWEALLIRSSAPVAELRAAVKQTTLGLSPEIETSFQLFESQVQWMFLRELYFDNKVSN